MKRSRVGSPAAESSAGAARRVCTREHDTAHSDGDTTFFFIKLPSGNTITADLPLNSTFRDLVQYLEHKVGRIKATYCWVVGKHTAQLDETLQAAGVSRDCTVQMQLTRIQTPYDYYNQQHDSIKRLVHELQQPHLGPDEFVASLSNVIGWLMPSQGHHLWKTAIGFKEADDLANTAQHVVTACCTLTHHPSSSIDQVYKAILWLQMLSHWAYQGILYATGTHGADGDKQAGMNESHGLRQPMMECEEVLRVAELWLMASAAAMQITLYNCKLWEDGTDVNGIVLEDRLVKLSEVAASVADWLEEPIDPDTLSWLTSQARTQSDVRACALPAVHWCTSGRATLLYLRLKFGDPRSTAIAALLQGMTAMWADHLMSCYQNVFKTLPGLTNALPATSAISSASTIPGLSTPIRTAAPRASNTCVPSTSVLLSLAHASVLVNPVVQAHVSSSSSKTPSLFPEGTVGANRWQDRGHPVCCGAGPPALVVQQVTGSLAESAMHRLLVGGGIRDMAGETGSFGKLAFLNSARLESFLDPNCVFFGGGHRALWDFMPLITTALDHIKAYADFANVHNINSSGGGLPQLLRKDAAILELLQSCLLLSKLAANARPAQHAAAGDVMDDSPAETALAAQPGKTAAATPGHDGMVEVVSGLLQHPLVQAWLEKVNSGLSLQSCAEDSRTVIQELINMIAWWPQLAEALPTSTRSRWLQQMLFPRYPGYVTDDDDGEFELDIRRDMLLEDSYAELLSLSPSELRFGVRIRFADEEAQGEGVLREWLVQVASRLFNPLAALFECGATDMSVQHPSAAASVQTDWRNYFRLAGRIVGLALRHRVPLGIQLSTAFYKTLQSIEADASSKPYHPWITAISVASTLQQQEQQQQWESWGAAADGRGVMVVNPADPRAWCHGFRFVTRPWRVQHTLDDLQQMDPQVASSMQYLLDHTLSSEDMAIKWTVSSSDVGDVSDELELVPGASDLAVTEDNKVQFVDAMIEHKLLGGCKEQALWFYVGLCDAAEPKTLDLCQGRLLLPVTTSDFNSQLFGSHSSLEVPAWRAATTVGSSLKGNERLVDMFWTVVGELDQQQRRQLLRFWTGVTHLPASGFSGLGRLLQITALTLVEPPAPAVPAPAAEGGQAPAAEENPPAAVAVDQAVAADGDQASTAEAAGVQPAVQGGDGQQPDADMQRAEQEEAVPNPRPTAGVLQLTPERVQGLIRNMQGEIQQALQATLAESAMQSAAAAMRSLALDLGVQPATGGPPAEQGVPNAEGGQLADAGPPAEQRLDQGVQSADEEPDLPSVARALAQNALYELESDEFADQVAETAADAEPDEEVAQAWRAAEERLLAEERAADAELNEEAAQAWRAAEERLLAEERAAEEEAAAAAAAQEAAEEGTADVDMAPAAAEEDDQAQRAAAEGDQAQQATAEGDQAQSAAAEGDKAQSAAAEGDQAQSAAADVPMAPVATENNPSAESEQTQQADAVGDGVPAGRAGSGTVVIPATANATAAEEAVVFGINVMRHIAAAQEALRAVQHHPGSNTTAAPVAQASMVLQLPRAHTCFMQLLLPVGYQSTAELRRALLVALENVDYFGRA